MLLIPAYLSQSPIHGIGLFAATNLPAGAMVWRFTAGFDLRYSESEIAALPAALQPFLRTYGWKNHRTNYYCFASDDARFFNHSDKPNCRSRYEEGEDDVVTYALRDIRCGEELTDDDQSFDADYCRESV